MVAERLIVKISILAHAITGSCAADTRVVVRCRGRAIVTRHSTHVHTWRANRADSNVMEVAVKAVERRSSRCILRAVLNGRRPLCARSFYLLLQIRFTARLFFRERENLCFAVARVTERRTLGESGEFLRSLTIGWMWFRVRKVDNFTLGWLIHQASRTYRTCFRLSFLDQF